MKIKTILKSVLEPLCNKLGFVRKDKVRLGQSKFESLKNELMGDFFKTIIALGFSPNHIVDIGANRGNWTREALIYFPDAIYTLFEPQAQLKKSMKDLLQKPNVECLNIGVGRKSADLQFTIVDRDDSCSFMYSKEDAKLMGYHQITVPVVALNDFFKESSKPIPDLIKIDAEGLDLDVLKGATNFLGKTEIILMEAAVVCDVFDNDIKTVIDEMNTYGYKLFDITDLNKPFKKQVLWLTELAFILKGGFLDSQKIK